MRPEPALARRPRTSKKLSGKESAVASRNVSRQTPRGKFCQYLVFILSLISCYVGGFIVTRAVRREVAAVQSRRESANQLSHGDFRDVQFDAEGWNATTIEVLTPFEPTRDLTAGDVYVDCLLHSHDADEANFRDAALDAGFEFVKWGDRVERLQEVPIQNEVNQNDDESRFDNSVASRSNSEAPISR
jgi:hypothetical protein